MDILFLQRVHFLAKLCFHWGSCYSICSYLCFVLKIVVFPFSFGHCVVCPSCPFSFGHCVVCPSIYGIFKLFYKTFQEHDIKIVKREVKNQKLILNLKNWRTYNKYCRMEELSIFE